MPPSSVIQKSALSLGGATLCPFCSLLWLSPWTLACASIAGLTLSSLTSYVWWVTHRSQPGGVWVAFQRTYYRLRSPKVRARFTYTRSARSWCSDTVSLGSFRLLSYRRSTLARDAWWAPLASWAFLAGLC